MPVNLAWHKEQNHAVTASATPDVRRFIPY